MQAILAYYDAQREYSTVDHNGDGVHEYAQKFVSTKGKKDGLYWESPLGLDESPLGPLRAKQQPKGGAGYYGYHYKILTKQGKDAAGGAYDYIIGKRMPHISGLDVLRALQQADAHVPAVIITGDDSPETRAQATAHGAWATLRKPVDDAMLLDAIDTALRASAARVGG